MRGLRWLTCVAAIVATPALAGADGLEGQWTQKCTQMSSSTTWDDSVMTIAGDSFNWTGTSFDDASCEKKSVWYSGTGTYVTSDVAGLPEGARGLDFHWTSVKFAPFDAQTVEALNQIGWCGHTDWVAGEAKEIVDCEDLVKVRYDIYKVDGTSLFVGKDSADRDGTAPDKRPTELDPTPLTRL